MLFHFGVVISVAVSEGSEGNPGVPLSAGLFRLDVGDDLIHHCLLRESEVISVFVLGVVGDFCCLLDCLDVVVACAV